MSILHLVIISVTVYVTNYFLKSSSSVKGRLAMSASAVSPLKDQLTKALGVDNSHLQS